MVMTTIRKSKDELLLAMETIAQYGLASKEHTHLLDVGTKPFLDFFEKELFDELASRGGATCKFFEGTYGSGKTHLLQLLRQRALEKGMAVASFDLSQDLRLEDWKQITQYMLEQLEIRIDGKPVKSLPKIIEALQLSGSDRAKALKAARLPHPGYQNAMWWATERNHINSTAWYAIGHYLNGNKVGVPELRRHQLLGVKGNLNQRNAELVMRTVLEGLYLLGVPGVVLLFDENERTLQTNKNNQPTRKMKVAANLMRRLIDGCTTGVMVGVVSVFAVLPGFVEMCSEHYPALGQRMLLVREGQLSKKAWRVPALSLDQVNTVQSPYHFLEKAADMFVDSVKSMGGTIVALKEELMKIGNSVIEQHAGDGYRRILMKQLAYHCLTRVKR